MNSFTHPDIGLYLLDLICTPPTWVYTVTFTHGTSTSITTHTDLNSSILLLSLSVLTCHHNTHPQPGQPYPTNPQHSLHCPKFSITLDPTPTLPEFFFFFFTFYQNNFPAISPMSKLDYHGTYFSVKRKTIQLTVRTFRATTFQHKLNRLIYNSKEKVRERASLPAHDSNVTSLTYLTFGGL